MKRNERTETGTGIGRGEGRGREKQLEEEGWRKGLGILFSTLPSSLSKSICIESATCLNREGKTGKKYRENKNRLASQILSRPHTYSKQWRPNNNLTSRIIQK